MARDIFDIRWQLKDTYPNEGWGYDEKKYILKPTAHLKHIFDVIMKGYEERSGAGLNL